jgi:hypothetical protein
MNGWMGEGEARRQESKSSRLTQSQNREGLLHRDTNLFNAQQQESHDSHRGDGSPAARGVQGNRQKGQPDGEEAGCVPVHSNVSDAQSAWCHELQMSTADTRSAHSSNKRPHQQGHTFFQQRAHLVLLQSELVVSWQILNLKLLSAGPGKPLKGREKGSYRV